MSNFFTYSKIQESFFRDVGEKITIKEAYPLVWSHDDIPWVFFLESGLVKACIHAHDNSDSILGYFVPGATFAQSGSFFSTRTMKITYETITPCEIYRVKPEVFWEKINTDIEFSNDYLKTVLRNNLLLIDRIAYQNEKVLKQKIVMWLRFMYKYYGIENENGHVIEIALTQETIAEFLHCSRESVSTTLKELSNQGIISVEKKIITITDLETLNELENFS